MSISESPLGFRNVLISLIDAINGSSDSIEASGNGPKSSEPIRLLEAIYFSKRFVPTYYVFLALVLVVTSVQRFSVKKARRRKLNTLNNVEKGSPQTSSSASSTLVEEDTTNSKDVSQTEQTPLLKRAGTFSVQHTFASRLRYRFRAWSVSQPKPIPAWTASVNSLPSNGTSFLIAVFFLVNVFYLFYNLQFTVATIFAFGYRAAFCLIVNLPILYLLGAKNNQPLKWLTGWSYERVNIFHRRLGEWLVLLGLSHAISMCITWYTIIRPQGYTFIWFVTRPVIILGIIAILSYGLLWATSIGYVREKAYEFFLISHIALQFLALGVLFFHSTSSRPYVGMSLAITMLDRIVSRMCLSSKRFVATLEIAADKETVLLFCDIAIDVSRRKDIRGGWKAGQHVFLSVPGMTWHHAYQAHPFTIASPAPASEMDGRTWPLQLTIRCRDGFSKELLQYAEFHQHAVVYLDGPYGDFELEAAVLSADRVCLIAGGSGIAVTYPLAWSLRTAGKDFSLISNRTVYAQGKKHVPQLSLISDRVHQTWMHLWVRQSPVHQSWLTMFPTHQASVMASIQNGDSNRCVDLVSQTFETRRGMSSRPDMATELRMWLEHSDDTIPGRDRHVCVVVSGPDGLVRDVKNCVAALTRKGYNIEVHAEKFGW